MQTRFVRAVADRERLTASALSAVLTATSYGVFYAVMEGSGLNGIIAYSIGNACGCWLVMKPSKS